jgi:predicted RNA-binding protein with PIN domain
MTVHFAQRNSDADEMIEDLLEAHTNPRSLTVVSCDHRVQRAARHHGATFVDSEQWYSDLKATLRSRKSANNDAAKPAAATPDELAYWLKEFGDAPTPPDSDAIFPPGYADDLTDDD